MALAKQGRQNVPGKGLAIWGLDEYALIAMTGHAQGNQQFRNTRRGKCIGIKFAQHQTVFLQVAECPADIIAERFAPRVQIAIKALRKADAGIAVDLAPVAFEPRTGAKEWEDPRA